VESRAYRSWHLQHPLVLPDHDGTLHMDGRTPEPSTAQEIIPRSLQEILLAGAWTFGTRSHCVHCLESKGGHEAAKPQDEKTGVHGG